MVKSTNVFQLLEIIDLKSLQNFTIIQSKYDSCLLSHFISQGVPLVIISSTHLWPSDILILHRISFKARASKQAFERKGNEQGFKGLEGQ